MSFYNKKIAKPINIAPIPKEFLQNKKEISSFSTIKKNPIKIAENEVPRKFKIKKDLKKVSEYPEQDNDGSQLDTERTPKKQISNFEDILVRENSSQLINMNFASNLKKTTIEIPHQGFSGFDGVVRENSSQLINKNFASNLKKTTIEIPHQAFSAFDGVFNKKSTQILKI